MVAYAYNSSPWKMEAGASRVQAWPRLNSAFRAKRGHSKTTRTEEDEITRAN